MLSFHLPCPTSPSSAQPTGTCSPPQTTPARSWGLGEHSLQQSRGEQVLNSHFRYQKVLNRTNIAYDILLPFGGYAQAQHIAWVFRGLSALYYNQSHATCYKVKKGG